MTPGLELDALIAEKVMGLSVSKEIIRDGSGARYYPELLHYSTDIAAAWEVVEKMGTLPRKDMQRGGFQVNYDDHGWTASFWREYAFGESAPHAICLAALKALAPREDK
jgi:hypothetical protein